MNILKLPDRNDGSKQGVDDFFAAGGSVEDLLAFSEPFTGNEARAPGWPVLADEAYHGLAGEAVRAIGPNTESDPADLLATILAKGGNAIGRGAHFVIEDDEHFCSCGPCWSVKRVRRGRARERSA